MIPKGSRGGSGPSWPKWDDVTAIFGGTFDPPHLGHRDAVAGLFKNPGVGRVLVMPSAIPPHKTSFAPTPARVDMTRLAFEAMPDVSVDLREIERSLKNPQERTYTYDTLMDLRRSYPKLAFVIGTDQLEALETWKRFPDILALCHWIALDRKPSRKDSAGRALSAWESGGLIQSRGDGRYETKGQTILTICDTEAPAVSSSRIREEIARSGKPPEGVLSGKVGSYLKLHRIYGTSSLE